MQVLKAVFLKDMLLKGGLHKNADITFYAVWGSFIYYTPGIILYYAVTLLGEIWHLLQPSAVVN